MILTEKDYQNLAEQICESGEVATIEGDEYLEVCYDYQEEGYREDDFNLGYGNGTGAWVITDVFLDIRSWSCTDEDGEETDCDLDEYRLYECVRERRIG